MLGGVDICVFYKDNGGDFLREGPRLLCLRGMCRCNAWHSCKNYAEYSSPTPISPTKQGRRQDSKLIRRKFESAPGRVLSGKIEMGEKARRKLRRKGREGVKSFPQAFGSHAPV